MTGDRRPAAEAGLGRPRLHLRLTDSTNTRARELAAAGAPHGTVVTAAEQRAGRGRQGRTWTAPAGRALLCSTVVRQPPRLLPLLTGVAVAEAIAPVAPDARLKWPNDVHVEGRKVAGILVEGRPQERWAVVGVGLNVALTPEDFPPELADTATGLGLSQSAIEEMLAALLGALARWLTASEQDILEAVRARDALGGRPVGWATGEGTAAGIDSEGRLLVRTADGSEIALDAGEVHLRVAPESPQRATVERQKVR